MFQCHSGEKGDVLIARRENGMPAPDTLTWHFVTVLPAVTLFLYKYRSQLLALVARRQQRAFHSLREPVPVCFLLAQPVELMHDRFSTFSHLSQRAQNQNPPNDINNRLRIDHGHNPHPVPQEPAYPNTYQGEQRRRRAVSPEDPT